MEAHKSSLEVLLKVENEQRIDIEPLMKHALMLRKEIYQMQLQIADEVLKVRQVEARLEEISGIASQFKDKTQGIMEILQRRLTWLETTKEPLANALIKDSERVKLEYELIGFGNTAAEELITTAQRTKGVCIKFCRKVLTTHNRCQTSSKNRLDELPEHEDHLKQLHARWEEDELGIQLIKSLDERVLKNVIVQAAVRNHLLEDQL